ncbi:MAG: sugar phosphate isomerase/epimerase [Bacteroidales bacterium]|nr:sugar phosphate isomerase/epimerase [Bacteroidales bacterium]
MENTRRSFLKTAGAGSLAVVSAAGAILASCKNEGKIKTANKPENLTLNLSCQEGVAPGETLTEKLDFLEANGFTGFEPSGKGITDRVDELKQALSGRNIKISVICAGFDGYLIADKPEPREKAMKSIAEILTAAGELGAYGVIVVPAFNNQPSIPFVESRELLVSQLKELGKHAATHNTRIILEPLNRKEAWFLRLVADAAAICRDADNPGVGCMGDFWHMTWEETSDMGAFLSAGKYLTHVHIASRQTRNMPGEDANDNYVEGFKGLKYIKYNNFVSFECGSKGDKKLSIPAAVRLLKEQWDQA